MDDLALIIDLHARHERQGPGSDDETRRALSLARLGLSARGGAPIAAADIGCGTGASALVLARELGARVTAIDAAAPFIERLQERAESAGLAGRIDARVGRMESLPFADGSLDLIWSEGAIYNMGFGAGVRAWRRFLRPGGVLAVSELSWTTDARPAEIEDHWTREYPAIATASANLRTLEEAGYRPLGYFVLPEACWEEHYYAPIRGGLDAFLDRHGHADAARAIAAGEREEMRLRRAFGAWYGYGFYIAQRLDAGA